MNEPGWPLAVISLLLVVNGFFVAAEFALAAAPEHRVAKLADDGSDAARRLLFLLRDTRAFNIYVSTAQVGITLASLGLGMYGEYALANWLEQYFVDWPWFSPTLQHAVATIITVALLTYLHVVIGEMVPKSLALASPANAALQMAPGMRFAHWLFHPITTLLNRAGDMLLRLFGVPPVDKRAHLVSSAELEYIVEESTVSGLLEPNQQLYLENVLDFGERALGQIMTPRTRVQTFSIEATIDEILQIVSQHGYSRYPVYQGERDQIVGIFHVKELARAISNDQTERPLATLLRPAVFVPETLSLAQMLQRFRSEHIQIAIVVDEFGGVAGLVTLEDLVEELIGEIQDEFDEELPPLEEINDTTLRVRGDLLIDELNQLYELELTHEEADTIGGMVTAVLGNIPSGGERVVIDQIKFDVEAVEGLAIRTLLVHLPPPEIEAPEVDEAATVEKQDRVDNVWTTSST